VLDFTILFPLAPSLLFKTGFQFRLINFYRRDQVSNIKYTEDHEWLREEADGSVTVGVTNYAQEQLGDLVYIQLPEVGRSYAKGDEAAVIESVKVAGEIKMPAEGSVTEVNQGIADDPALVNQDAEGAAWFFKFKPAAGGALDGLLDKAGYDAFVANH
jgi:glycine cleavage system H protein